MNETSKQIRLSLVIPCYNESGRIELMYKGIEDFIEKWKGSLEVIIVNDGSKDNTYSLLQSHPLYSAHKDIISIYTQDNTGKGGALKHGVLEAKGDYILTIDADMASPPTELIKWLNILGWQLKTDTIYIGSREHKESVIKNQGDRKVAGNIFNMIVRTLTPLNIKDTQCGFKLYPAELAKKYFTGLKTLGWAHDVEILYKAYLDKNKIVEMPLEWNAVEGSKIRLFRDGINMMAEVLGIVVKTKLQYKKAK
jgi:dolichyl-phosphate beta-glucosyltransferase